MLSFLNCAQVFFLFFFFEINIYRHQLSVCEVSLQEFPVWGLRSLTRLNLPFQMKAALRETVLFGRAAEPCLQTAGMWDVWSGGQEARKECQVCPCLSRAGWLAYSPQWRTARTSEYKGSSPLQSELRSTLLKLNSSFHQERKERLWLEQQRNATRQNEIDLIRRGFSSSNSKTKGRFSQQDLRKN